MRTLRQIAAALDAELAPFSVTTSTLVATLYANIRAIAADLRALAEAPTGADVAMLARAAELLDGKEHLRTYTDMSINTRMSDLAARLAAQQSAPAEEHAASPWEERREIEQGLAMLVPSPALLALIEALNRHKSLWKAW